ncbi:MAG: stage III sporulation protein AE [Clostridia bacterium]|nr:stage III sporulation protein AE [Clostridia bacterium]
MKNRCKISTYIQYFCILLILCLTFAIGIIQPHNVCYADNAQDSQEILQDNIDQNLSGLDIDSLQQLFDSLDGDFKSLFGEDVVATVKGIIQGTFRGDFSTFMGVMMKGLGKCVLDVLPMILTIIAVAIIYSLLEGLTSSFSQKPTRKLIYFATYSAIIVLVMAQVGSMISLTTNTINNVKLLMESIFPILLTLTTLLGGVNSSAFFSPLMATLTTFITAFISSVIIPFFIATIAFSIVGNMTSSVKLDKLTGFFKSTATYVLGGAFGIFIAFLTFQGLTGGVIDSISIKTAKFAMQSYIPILGGYLSDGFDLMLASLVLIKNSLGIVSLLMILGVIALPTLKIIVLSLALKLASGIIEPLCDSKFSKMLQSISSNLTLLIVSMLGVAFMFLLTVMLVIYTFNIGIA